MRFIPKLYQLVAKDLVFFHTPWKFGDDKFADEKTYLYLIQHRQGD